MLTQVALFTVLGKPLIFYGGILTFILLLATATMAKLGSRGKIKNYLKWHMRLAWSTIILATLHGLLGLAISFGL